jgi:hypothetical protein
MKQDCLQADCRSASEEILCQQPVAASLPESLVSFLIQSHPRAILTDLKSLNSSLLGCNAVWTWIWRQHVPPKLRTSLHDVTTKNNSVLIFIAVKASALSSQCCQPMPYYVFLHFTSKYFSVPIVIKHLYQKVTFLSLCKTPYFTPIQSMARLRPGRLIPHF